MPTASVDDELRVAPLPRNLLDCMRERGVDPEALALRLGIDPQRLASGLDFATVDHYFCAAWEALDDPAFGLRAGCVLKPERFGIVGIAVMCAPTLGAAFERKGRYDRLVWGDAFEVVRRGARARLGIAQSGPPRPYTQARIDMTLASIVTLARLVTRVAVQPLELALRQPPPAYRDRYAEVFGCPVAFEQADDAIVFRAQDLELPLVSANADLDVAVVGAAEARLADIDPAGDALGLRVRQALRRLLCGDEPTLAAVAAELRLSERTLQRRLAEQDLSFSAMLDAVRRDTALQHLRERHVSAEEVAFVLGFTTASSFFRAFKRWTGTTPQGWRLAQRTDPR